MPTEESKVCWKAKRKKVEAPFGWTCTVRIFRCLLGEGQRGEVRVCCVVGHRRQKTNKEEPRIAWAVRIDWLAVCLPACLPTLLSSSRSMICLSCHQKNILHLHFFIVSTGTKGLARSLSLQTRSNAGVAVLTAALKVLITLSRNVHAACHGPERTIGKYQPLAKAT